MSEAIYPVEGTAPKQFDVEKYRAKRAARPLAVHKAELIDELRKCLLSYDLEHSKLADLRVTLFTDACVTIADYRLSSAVAEQRWEDA